MKNLLAALRLVLADIASLGSTGNRALVGVIAGAIVAVVAAVAGVHLTAAEVTGWLLIAAGIAATLEKLTAVKAAQAAKSTRRK